MEELDSCPGLKSILVAAESETVVSASCRYWGSCKQITGFSALLSSLQCNCQWRRHTLMSWTNAKIQGQRKDSINLLSLLATCSPTDNSSVSLLLSKFEQNVWMSKGWSKLDYRSISQIGSIELHCLSLTLYPIRGFSAYLADRLKQCRAQSFWGLSMSSCGNNTCTTCTSVKSDGFSNDLTGGGIGKRQVLVATLRDTPHLRCNPCCRSFGNAFEANSALHLCISYSTFLIGDDNCTHPFALTWRALGDSNIEFAIHTTGKCGPFLRSCSQCTDKCHCGINSNHWPQWFVMLLEQNPEDQ